MIRQKNKIIRLKKSMTKIYLLAAILLFFSCNKDKNENQLYTIRYEVESDYHWDILIQWTGESGGVNGKKLVDANWEQIGSDTFSSSFTTEKKLNLYFVGENPNSLSDVKIRLFVNDQLVQSAEANSQLKAIISYQL